MLMKEPASSGRCQGERGGPVLEAGAESASHIFLPTRRSGELLLCAAEQMAMTAGLHNCIHGGGEGKRLD